MKNSLVRDKAKRKRVAQDELRRLSLKYRFRSGGLTPVQRWDYARLLSALPQKGSPVRVRNRCLLTGRGRSVHRPFRLSRIAFRDLAALGGINGLRKASW
jgi:small subunit ribosomal protein S14